MSDALDLWIVQLDDLIKHALEIRDTNVMGYKKNVKKAFEMGLNMLVLLMKKMIEDMVKEKNEWFFIKYIYFDRDCNDGIGCGSMVDDKEEECRKSTRRVR